MTTPITTSRPPRAGLIALASIASLLATSLAEAQSSRVGQARYGQRFKSIGWSAQPAIVLDGDAPPTTAHNEPMIGWGTLLTFGLHHYLHPHFAMAAELGLGLQWFDEHTISPDGASASEKALAWQAGLMGRYIPSERLQGPSLGLGMHLFNARLKEAPLQQLAAELRAGWIVWRGERAPQFAIAEFGLSAPIVQGLKLPDQVIVIQGEEPVALAPPNWSLWRGVVSVQVSF